MFWNIYGNMNKLCLSMKVESGFEPLQFGLGTWYSTASATEADASS
jgi:hypothetical protein